MSQVRVSPCELHAIEQLGLLGFELSARDRPTITQLRKLPDLLRDGGRGASWFQRPRVIGADRILHQISQLLKRSALAVVLTIVVGIEDKDAERLQQLAAERHQRRGEVISSLLRSA